jgi:outer membrane receptor for ferrienterochelin and colicins
MNHNGQFGWHLTPKVSGMLSLGENVCLRANWSQGFKTPTPKEQRYRYVKYMNATYLYLGNENLKPQTSNYYSMSAECNWKGLNMTVTGYLNRLDDMITLVTIPNTQAPAEYIVTYDPRKTRQYQNLETAETKGVDVSIRYRLNGEWMMGASYSYLDTDAKKYDSTHEKLVDVVIDGTAHHKGSWFATWSHPFRSGYQLGVGIYGRMSSTRYYQINGNGKGYQTWRSSTNHEFPLSNKLLLQAEAGIDNIFNYVDRTYHGLHLGTTTPGRTVYARLTVRLTNGKKLRFSNNNKFNSKSNENEQE